MHKFLAELDALPYSARTKELKEKMQNKLRVLSIEQARLVTHSYKENEGQSIVMKRAISLHDMLCHIAIEIDPQEIVVGNRSIGSKTGIVFPESGLSWLKEEMDMLPVREQDQFQVDEKSKKELQTSIYPYWTGHTLEDQINKVIGDDLDTYARAIKINQKDHAQGHICPNVEKWLKLGPAGIKKQVDEKRAKAPKTRQKFYDAASMVLEGACVFINRYAVLADEMASISNSADEKQNLLRISEACAKLAKQPPQTYYEAVQSMWFLFVILQAESNASSFSPGRLDQLLYPYYQIDMASGRLNNEEALEIMEAVWIKFNEIVYMRSTTGAAYFAGFPIGFNVIIGGQSRDGNDVTNELSYIMLKTQAHLQLPQPNFSARIHKGSPDIFYRRCAEVLRLGTGMPQFFNDESIIPAIKKAGVTHEDAMNYTVTGCVEITTPGNNLGWSDAAMVNLVKILELTLNNGVCMQTGRQVGLRLGSLCDYQSYEALEKAFAKQILFFIEKLTSMCEAVEQKHQELLPSAFLSCVVDDCIDNGVDVTAGGAKYNYSGIQIIQAANLADCMAALKALVFDRHVVDKADLLKNLRENYPDEQLRLTMLNKAPKYGNDVEWVDLIANKWVAFFAEALKKKTNYRGGPYQTGMYTVSAHVPMGKNVGASPDGRKNGEPLADGGLSAVYGRDKHGPTALLNSVNRIDSKHGSNGTLLNMKFSPTIFNNAEGFEKFCMLIKSLTNMQIHHVQFNVLNKEDLINAKKEPEKYQNLLVRVAGYTAYFVELSRDLQDEIIARTEFGNELS